jgi:hypothetical protein
MCNIVITYLTVHVRYEKRKKVESLYGPRRNSISNLFFNPGRGEGPQNGRFLKGQLRERFVWQFLSIFTEKLRLLEFWLLLKSWLI